MQSDLPAQMWNRETLVSLLQSWPEPGRGTSRLLVWVTSQKLKCLQAAALQGSFTFALNEVSSLLWDQPAQGLPMNRMSSSTPELVVHSCPNVWLWMYYPIIDKTWEMIWVWQPPSLELHYIAQAHGNHRHSYCITATVLLAQNSRDTEWTCKGSMV